MNCSAVAWCTTATCLFSVPKGPMRERAHAHAHTDKIGPWFELLSSCAHAIRRQRAGLPVRCWDSRAWSTVRVRDVLLPPAISDTAPGHSHVRPGWHSGTVHPPPPLPPHPNSFFCKTTIINQNPISQQRQLLLEWQMFGGRLQRAFQLFHSLPPPHAPTHHHHPTLPLFGLFSSATAASPPFSMK